MALVPNERMVRVSAPTELGDAWVCSFEGKTTIELSATPRPFGGVFVEQACAPNWRPLDRISLWLTSFESIGADAIPPQLEWEIYARVGTATHRLARLAMTAPTWAHRGLIAQCAGVLCQGFEVWARTVGVAQPVRVNAMVVVDRAGLQFERIPGDFVTVLP
ncbi:MAG: hypothetical protein Q8Q09_01665 [Deltaproteobacteria bacterium]|nr:hypothetical protein [Deltaproteobacteria bacterium]